MKKIFSALFLATTLFFFVGRADASIGLGFINDFVATPRVLSVGSDTFLIWKVDAAKVNRCLLSGPVIDSGNIDGTIVVNFDTTGFGRIAVSPDGSTGLKGDSVFNLRCFNKNNSNQFESRSITVEVPNGKRLFIPTIKNFTSDKTSYAYGQNAVFSWQVSNASECSISQLNRPGIFNVDSMIGVGDFETAPLGPGDAYVLNCKNLTGATSRVINLIVVDRVPVISNFRVDKNPAKIGESVRFSWNISNIDVVNSYCTMKTPVGSVNFFGRSFFDLNIGSKIFAGNYSLACSSGSSGIKVNATNQVALSITEPALIPVINYFRADKTEVSGDVSEVVRFSFSVSNADYCKILSPYGALLIDFPVANTIVSYFDYNTTPPKDASFGSYNLLCSNKANPFVTSNPVTITKKVQEVAINNFTIDPPTISPGVRTPVKFSWDITKASYPFYCNLKQPNGWTIAEGMGKESELGVNFLPRVGTTNDSINTIGDYRLDCYRGYKESELVVSKTFSVKASAVPSIVSFSADKLLVEKGASTLVKFYWSLKNLDTTNCAIVEPDGIEHSLTPVNLVSGVNSLYVSKAGDYYLSCKGGGVDSKIVNIKFIELPAPLATLAANPMTVEDGVGTILTWKSTNASTCRLDSPRGLLSEELSGEIKSGALIYAKDKQTQKFTLTCLNKDGKSSMSQVYITIKPPKIPTIDLFTSDLTEVIEGNSVKLSWISSNSEYCNLSDGPETSTQNFSVRSGATRVINANTTFTLRCFGKSADGTILESKPIDKSIKVKIIKPVINDFSFSPTTIEKGTSATIKWNVTNFASWAVSKPSFGCYIYGPSPIVGQSVYSAKAIGTFITPALLNDTDYRIKCTNAYGTAEKSFKINPIIPKITIKLFTADKLSVDKGGSVNLKWEVDGAEYCNIYGPDFVSGTAVPLNSAKVSTMWPIREKMGIPSLAKGTIGSGILEKDSTYRLACSNKFTTVRGGDNDAPEAFVTIDVVTPVVYPKIDSFSASPATVTKGGNTILSWNTRDADYCSIQGPGFTNSAGVDTGVKTSGSASANSLYSDATFILSCKNASNITQKNLQVGVIVPPGVISGGDLNITSLNSEIQPRTIVGSEKNIPFNRILLTAGANDVNISGISVVESGDSDAYFYWPYYPALSHVFILDESGKQISSTAYLGGNHRATISMPLTIKAGTAKTITIAGHRIFYYDGRIFAAGYNSVKKVSLDIENIGTNAKNITGTVPAGEGKAGAISGVVYETGDTSLNKKSIAVTGYDAKNVSYPQIDYFKSSHISVQKGGVATLSWSVSKADTCVLVGALASGQLNVSSVGSIKTNKLSAKSSFFLRCSKKSGSTVATETQYITVDVGTIRTQ